MNPIREQIRDSRARNKRHNSEWWTANNSLLKINAEISRAEQQVARLECLRAEKAALDGLQATIKAKMTEEDAWQEALEGKLREQIVTKQSEIDKRRTERRSLAASKIIARSIASDADEDAGGFRQ